MRKLATVERIISIAPIDGADFIEVAQVKGWTCVVKKGEFKAGDLGAYFEIDSVPPDTPPYQFLWKKPPDKESPQGKEVPRPNNFRLKTRRYKGVISQGLMLPLSVVGISADGLKEGDDLTERLGVIKYDPPEVEDEEEVGATSVQNQKRNIESEWPDLAPKTNENRVQNVHLEVFNGLPYVITRKLDGSSGTYGWGKEPRFSALSKKMRRSPHRILRETSKLLKFIGSFLPGVDRFYSCSRKHARGPDTTWGKIAAKYRIAEKLIEHGYKRLVIQGELVGPKIQGNPRALSDVQFYVFNVFDQETKCYLPAFNARLIAYELGLEFVPILDSGESFSLTQDQLLRLAEGLCPGMARDHSRSYQTCIYYLKRISSYE